MQKLCFYLSFECTDYWANRYQTLIVGLVAILVAFRQSVIARNQMRISERQFDMMEDQANQAKALARLKVDRALRPLLGLPGRMISQGKHNSAGEDSEGHPKFEWHPELLRFFAALQMDWSDDEIEEAAVQAFPEHAADIGQLLIAARTAKALANEYASGSWDRFPGPQGGIDQRNFAMDAAFNDLLKYRNRLSSIVLDNG